MGSSSKLWVVALVVVTALVLALSVIVYLNYVRTQWYPRVKVEGTVIEVHGKPPNLMNSLINSSCELLRNSLHYNVRPVFRVLDPHVLSNLTSFLKGVTGLRGFTYVATIMSGDTNYSVFEVIIHNNSLVGRLYYVSWRLTNNNRGVKVLNYGEVRLKEVASNLNNIKPCGGLGYFSDEALKYLKHLRGNFTVFKFTEVPKPLSNVYVVLMYYRVVIGDGNRVFMNSSMMSKFFVDYGNKVLKIEGPVIPPYDRRELSIEVVKHLSNLSTGTSYVVVDVFLKGIMFSIHKVVKIPIAFFVDPFLGVAYPEEGRYGIGYRVVQVWIQS